jgi:hypothetical protein
MLMTASAAYPQWWKVDLGATLSLGNCDIYWYLGASRSYKYRIEASTDDVNYTTIVDKSTNTVNYVKSTDALNTSARYVRVTVVGSSAGWASMYDVQIFDPLKSANDAASNITASAVVYPNPVANGEYLTISLSNITNAESNITIYDLNGRTLLNQTISSPQVQLNTSDLIRGIYVVVIKSGSVIMTQKLIVQ